VHVNLSILYIKRKRCVYYVTNGPGLFMGGIQTSNDGLLVVVLLKSFRLQPLPEALISSSIASLAKN